MTILVVLQNDLDLEPIPTLKQFQHWTDTVFKYMDNTIPQGVDEVCIRIVDEEESADLNENFRKKSGATNVLSFPNECDFTQGDTSLGDIAICAQRVVHEAEEQGIPIENHWAHLTIHGILHLLGFDHIEESDALEMESLEIAILKSLNINDPYKEALDD